MVTNVTERNTKKCELYWPECGLVQTCGPFNLSVVEEQIFADYIIRSIQLVVRYIQQCI